MKARKFIKKLQVINVQDAALLIEIAYKEGQASLSELSPNQIAEVIEIKPSAETLIGNFKARFHRDLDWEKDGPFTKNEEEVILK